jgi:hypothetical protein
MTEKSQTVRITADCEKALQKVLHQLEKESQNATRYGHTVTIERIAEVEDRGGFE